MLPTPAENTDCIDQFLTFPSSMSQGDADALDSILDSLSKSNDSLEHAVAAAIVAACTPRVQSAEDFDPSLSSTREFLAEPLFSPLAEILHSAAATPFVDNLSDKLIGEDVLFGTPYMAPEQMDLFSSKSNNGLMLPPAKRGRAAFSEPAGKRQREDDSCTPVMKTPLPTTPSIRNLLASSPYLFAPIPSPRNSNGFQEQSEPDQDMDPMEFKRRRNTEAARKSRARKVARMNELENQVVCLNDERQRLEMRVAVLENEKGEWSKREAELRGRIRELETAMLHS